MENRVIKFRVWDKPTKSWCDSFFTDPIKGFTPFPYQKVSQFTGLVDGKGNEIFEGDIFEIVFGELFKQSIVVNGFVVFKFGGFHVEFIAPQTNDVHYVELFKLLKNDEKVVIGNIYENPELISDGRDQ